MRLFTGLIGLGLVMGFSSSVAAQFIPGDINDDKEVNVLDPTVLRREIAGLGPGILQMCLSTFPATGQTTCWDSIGSVITCAGTGHDGDSQAGAVLSYLDNGDGTISDLNTGLMWAKKSDDGSIHDKDKLYDWNGAFAVHVAGLNSAVFAGHTDWRLPNARELHSIADLERLNPAVDPAFNTGCAPACTVSPCSCTASFDYWSATSYVFDGSNAWIVGFFDGGVGLRNKFFGYSVRAVRGGL